MSRDRERLLVEKCAAAEERCTQVQQECDGLRQVNADLHLALDKEKVQPVFIVFCVLFITSLCCK